MLSQRRVRREPTGDAPEAPDTWGVLEHQALDVRDRAAMLAALEGVDAVLWCVGVTKSSGGDVGTAAVSKRDIASAMVNLAQGRQWIAASPFLHAGRG